MKDIKKRFLDSEIIGFKFGKLLPLNLSAIRTKNRGKQFNCICDCGNNVVVRGHSLRHGVKSCGCIRVELLRKRATKHLLSNHILFKRWWGMIERCENEKATKYKNYGGRGISVCKEWRHNFLSFYNWAMAHGWKKKLHIDRKNNNGHYTPGNCHFVSVEENNLNQRNSCIWVIDGERFKSLSIAGNKFNVSGCTIRRWCIGYVTSSGGYIPPKQNCYKEKLYVSNKNN